MVSSALRGLAVAKRPPPDGRVERSPVGGPTYQQSCADQTAIQPLQPVARSADLSISMLTSGTMRRPSTRPSLDEGVDETADIVERHRRSEEHTSELQSLMRISYAVFCLKKKTNIKSYTRITQYPQHSTNYNMRNN